MNLLPTISIITVVRNGERSIEHAIKSIISQTYKNIEYIIIDGKSTDGTVEKIQKYHENINYWISEPDSGIYDAMNKGVLASNGDWLLFINADDHLVSATSIEEAVSYLTTCEKSIAYGKINFTYPNGSVASYGSEWNDLKYRFRNVAACIPHQATFHAKALFAGQYFDTSFRIAGDYDFLLRHLKDHDACFIPVTVTNMDGGGISATVSKIDLLKDTRKAQIKNNMYRFSPSISWYISAIKLLVVDSIIRTIGIRGKDKIRDFFRFSKPRTLSI
ncbi:MAG: glycosyltransferase family 2 protein [Dyadobacter sp.]|uniref:glycosyltransferase family 2 protein n=1 Tax=Dyadobacter sp. TaxID=1914288 RepID=UPI0032647870